MQRSGLEEVAGRARNAAKDQRKAAGYVDRVLATIRLATDTACGRRSAIAPKMPPMGYRQQDRRADAP
jgi:hypothetical protein